VHSSAMPSPAELRDMRDKHFRQQRIIATNNIAAHGKTSQQLGVCFCITKYKLVPWEVSFKRKGVTRHVGRFATERQAVAAAREYIKQHPRVCDYRVNSGGKPTRSNSGYRGVYLDHGKFIMSIGFGKNQLRKCFSTAEGAALAYDELVRRRYGDGGICNFLPDGSRNPESMTAKDRATWLAEQASKVSNYLK
jgi:hypothetical protein